MTPRVDSELILFFFFFRNREEAENATELEMDVGMPGGPTNSGLVGLDALSVRGHGVGKSIRTFDDA